MGFKRPFDDEEFQELPFKQSRQLDYCSKRTQFSEFVPSNDAHQKPNVSGEDEGGFHNSQWPEAFKNDTATEISNLADKEFESSAPLSWLTGSSTDEDAGSGATAYSSLSPEFFEFDFPQRTFVPFDDAYSSLLDRSARRPVPLGPNHQVNVPLWGGHMKKNKLDQKEAYNPNSYSSLSLGSDRDIDDDNEDKFMGTCVIPMPDLNMSNNDKAGVGRRDCSCLDEGSVRCVRQHVMEAREKLLKTLGHEKFVKLGFYDMGDEVARKWSDEEERVFHEVVYSNPASLNRNFWKHLSVVFPSRTKKEIVCYYFNVFMLQRRAAQNRSNFLDIDSDDDEWHGIKGGSYGVRVSEEDEDSAIESPVDQDDQADNEDNSLEGEEDDDDDNDDDDDDGDGDVGDGSGDVTGEDSGIDHTSEAPFVKSYDDGRFDPAAQRMDKFLESDGEEYNVQDYSCMSFEFQPNVVDFCGPVDSGPASQVSGVKTDLRKCLRSNFDGCNDLAGHMYLLEPCDTKVWDARYTVGLMKGVDLLPTCNIIEEIFGQGTLDSKTRND